MCSFLIKNIYCSHKFKNTLEPNKYTRDDPDIFSQRGGKFPLLLNTQKKNKNDRKEPLILNRNKLFTYGKSNLKKTTHVHMSI